MPFSLNIFYVPITIRYHKFQQEIIFNWLFLVMQNEIGKKAVDWECVVNFMEKVEAWLAWLYLHY